MLLCYGFSINRACNYSSFYFTLIRHFSESWGNLQTSFLGPVGCLCNGDMVFFLRVVSWLFIATFFVVFHWVWFQSVDCCMSWGLVDLVSKPFYALSLYLLEDGFRPDHVSDDLISDLSCLVLLASSHMCLSFFQFSWWLSTSGLEWMLCRWWFWRLDEIVVDQLRKSDTLFDFWHRVLISLSCLPSSVNISIPNILLNTVIIFNLNHNLVHRTLSLLIPVHFRHLLFIHDDMYMYCSVYSQTQPFPTWFIQ